MLLYGLQSDLHLLFTQTIGDAATFNITKTRLFKYIEKFTSKSWKFSDKKLYYIFRISAQKTRL